MKTLLILQLLLTTSLCFGNSISNERDVYDKPAAQITPKVLRKQLLVQGNVFVLNPNGERLHSVGQEMRQWKFSSTGDLTSHWSFSSKEVPFVAMKHVWKIDKKGRLSVDIKQYAKSSVSYNDRGKPLYKGKPIKEKSFIIKNFEPVTWVASNDSKYRVVVRLSPSLNYNREAQQIGKIPISAKNMIAADNKGFVWTSDASFAGEYITLKTSRGTVHISYLPFKGSKEVGYAEDNKMRISLGKKHHLRLINSTQFLPSGMQAKVFGKVDLSEKVSKGSTHIQSSSEEDEFLAGIK